MKINCTASGKPDPDVRWIKNGTVTSLGKKTSLLAFSRINRADDGQYTCRANNSAGNDENHVALVVDCKKYLVLTITPENQGYISGAFLSR